jgi:hypothetical protein
VLLVLVVAPAALAGARTTGDGILELRSVDATKATITGTRGAIWGQIDSGTLKVTDANLDDNLVAQVSGADRIRVSTDPGVTYYIGKNIHFRFSGAKYKFTISNGVGIDLTAVGVGKASLAGDPTLLDDGSYAIDNGKWQPVQPAPAPPLLPKVLTFGLQPPSAGP